MFENFTSDTLVTIATHTGIFLLILAVSFLLAKLVRKLMKRKSNFVRIERTHYKFMSHFVSGFIYFVGILMALYSIPAFRGLSASIFAGSGILAIIIGFASQQAIGNIVSGIFIAVFKPFRIGDRMQFAEKNLSGYVEDITLRHTIIQTFDNKRIIVPNSVISAEVLINESIVEQKTIKYFDIGISYDSDIDKAIQVIREEVKKHPNFFDNRSEAQIAENVDPVTVRVMGFGDSSVNLRGYVWAKDPRIAFIMGCDLNKSVKERFDKEGIEIPFPYRTIVYKNQSTVNKNETPSV